MNEITLRDLYEWCSIPYNALANDSGLKVPFRLCEDSREMGEIMAEELASYVKEADEEGRKFRAIIPCGPSCWYKPFTDLINREEINLGHVTVFHMDECLDWQGRELPLKHPYSFRGFMEEHFYNPVNPKLAVPEENRFWLTPDTIREVAKEINSEPIDLTYGGWGQDGHIAYNQTRRHPFSRITIDDLKNSG